jgi:hypothetical protein
MKGIRSQIAAQREHSDGSLKQDVAKNCSPSSTTHVSDSLEAPLLAQEPLLLLEEQPVITEVPTTRLFAMSTIPPPDSSQYSDFGGEEVSPSLVPQPSPDPFAALEALGSTDPEAARAVQLLREKLALQTIPVPTATASPADPETSVVSRPLDQPPQTNLLPGVVPNVSPSEDKPEESSCTVA